MGILIGTFIGWTMVLQRALFTQLPIPFVFPWLQLGVVFVMRCVCLWIRPRPLHTYKRRRCSVIFSLFSLVPTRRVVSRSVVEILRIVV